MAPASRASWVATASSSDKYSLDRFIPDRKVNEFSQSYHISDRLIDCLRLATRARIVFKFIKSKLEFGDFRLQCQSRAALRPRGLHGIAIVSTIWLQMAILGRFRICSCRRLASALTWAKQTKKLTGDTPRRSCARLSWVRT